jgi:hypothetical protein
VQVHETVVDAVDVDFGVGALDGVEIRGQRFSVIVKLVDRRAALPPDFDVSFLA